MTLQPKKTKFRKEFKPVPSAVMNCRNHRLDKGTVGLKLLEQSRVSAAQMETLRRTVRRHMKKDGDIFFRIFPNHIVTAKPNEVRMGSGKGAPKFYTALAPSGTIIFEIAGVDQKIALEAVALAQKKIGKPSKAVIKPEGII